jgi:hypothetical protein
LFLYGETRTSTGPGRRFWHRASPAPVTRGDVIPGWLMSMTVRAGRGRMR